MQIINLLFRYHYYHIGMADDDNEMLMQLLNNNELLEQKVKTLTDENSTLKNKLEELTKLIQAFQTTTKVGTKEDIQEKHELMEKHIPEEKYVQEEHKNSQIPNENENKTIEFSKNPPKERYQPDQNPIINSKMEIDSEGYATIWYDCKANHINPFVAMEIIGEFTEYKPISMNQVKQGLFFVRVKFPNVPCKQKFVFSQKEAKLLSNTYQTTISSSASQYPMNFIYVLDSSSPALELSSLKSVTSPLVSDFQREAFSDIFKRESSVHSVDAIKPLTILVEQGTECFMQVISKSSNKIKIKRITDERGMLLDDSNNLILEINKDTIAKGGYDVVSQVEYNRIMTQPCKHYFEILYSVEGDEVMPVQCNKNIDMKVYELFVANKQITAVKHRQYGNMKFIAKLANEHLSIIKMVPLQIYYSVIDGCIFNMIHVHFSETSDQTTVSIEVMKQGSKIDDYKKFEKDALGNELYYKILVQNLQIVAVLYNCKTSVEFLQFNSIQVYPDKYYSIAFDKGSVSSIAQIPIGLMACDDPEKMKIYNRIPAKHNKISFCNEQHPEEFEGITDISAHIWMEKYLQEEYPISVPICQLHLATELQIKKLNDMKKTEQFKKVSPIKSLISKLNDKMATYKKEMKVDQQVELFDLIKKISNELGSKITSDLEEPLIKEINDVITKEEALERLLLPAVRISRMTKKQNA